MKTFSIKEAIKHGWELFKENQKFLILGTLIMLVIDGVGNGNDDHPWRRGSGFDHIDLSLGILGVALLVLGFIIKVGFLKGLLKIERGEKPGLKELVDHVELIWKYFLAAISVGLVVVLGFILLIIPGFYFLIKYNFVPLLVVDRTLGIKEAFRESSRITEGVRWKLLKFLFVICIVNILGAALFLVGLLVSVPVSMLAYVHVYKKLSSESVDPGVAPAVVSGI